ncbi:unnamed protein product [Dibothriocephalus latus]|uniref:E3 ubiquitin-protein ligase UBR5 ubiquitin-associated domain-containing protein n=1 Tax=Dibothriocephalus latus TaxID=60516 RepID=A0A3P6TGL2_DIBLA|nr:unnamed protein product [Dibothriocephalus latus]
MSESLKRISDQVKKDGVSAPEVLRPLFQSHIVESVIGPSHIAFRLEDGRVCRVAYFLRSDSMSTLEEKRKARSSDMRNDSHYSRDVSSGSTRSSGASATLRSMRSPLGVLGRHARGLSFLREMQRQGIYLARPISSQIPAAEVPESLIEQCQTVLQGKSRQLIVRELQRTNLDVNMAVNNLLSRDDETDIGSSSGTVGAPSAAEDWEDEAEDLFSIFEHPEGHLLFEPETGVTDELLDRAFSPRLRGELGSDYDYTSYSDRRKRRRLDAHSYVRNADTYGGRSTSSYIESRRFWRSIPGSSDDQPQRADEDIYESANPQSPSQNRYYVYLGDKLEFWPLSTSDAPGFVFTAIAALYSELLAVTSSATLGITGEKIVSLSACITRASVVTASGAIASWMDDVLPALLQATASSSSSSNALSLRSAVARFEHPATRFAELKHETVRKVHTATLISVVQCESGNIYWCSCLDPIQSARLQSSMDQVSQTEAALHAFACPHAITAWNNSNMPSTSFDQSATLADGALPTAPTTGEGGLGGSGSSLSLEMPPPPSPASSTCSDQSGPIKPRGSSRRTEKDSSTDFGGTRPATKRQHSSTNRAGNNSSESEELEDWCLNDVVFVEDGRTQPVGVLLKVDGNIAAVKFLKDCRLLKKDDLMVVKPTGLQRVPDFVQHSPRKVPTSFLSSKVSGESGPGTTTARNRKKLISIAPENGRIHAIVERLIDNPASGPPAMDPKTLEYHIFTLIGKTVSSHRLPILAQGAQRPAYDQLAYTCPAERPLLLRDSAGVVFPFLPTPRSGQEPWVFPQWLDLPSIQCAALSWLSPSCLSTFGDSQPAPSSGTTDANSKKNKEAKSRIPRILFGIIVVAETSLMQYILRAEDHKVEEALRSLATSTASKLQSVVHELSDGHRNILHMAVLMCAPQSNRETEWSDRLVNILANQPEGKFKGLELRNPSQTWNLTPTSKPLFSLLNL